MGQLAVTDRSASERRLRAMRSVRSDAVSRARTDPSEFQIDLVGELVVVAGHRRLVLPPLAQRLVALLAIEDRVLSRVKVCGTLFGDTSDAQAAARLRTALWRANEENPIILATGSQLVLDPRFEMRHKQRVDEVGFLVRGPVRLPVAVADLIEPLRRDLLEDWFDDWIDVERERFRQRRLHLFDELARRLLAEGRVGDAIDVALASLAADPLREFTNEFLVRAHLREGNRPEALRAFRRYDALLRRELGLGGSQELLDEVCCDGPLAADANRSLRP